MPAPAVITSYTTAYALTRAVLDAAAPILARLDRCPGCLAEWERQCDPHGAARAVLRLLGETPADQR